jgi:hypothetical protein
MNYRRIATFTAALVACTAVTLAAHAQQKLSVTFTPQSEPPLLSSTYAYATTRGASVQFDRDGELRIESPAKPFTLDLGATSPFSWESGTTSVTGAIYSYCSTVGAVPVGKLKGGQTTVCPMMLRVDSPAPTGYFYRLAFNRTKRVGASDVRFSCTGVKPGTTTCNQWSAAPAENEIASDGTLNGRGQAELLTVVASTMQEVSTSGLFDVAFSFTMNAQ